MRKRLYAMAATVGLVLTMAAPAWATVPEQQFSIADRYTWPDWARKDIYDAVAWEIIRGYVLDQQFVGGPQKIPCEIWMKSNPWRASGTKIHPQNPNGCWKGHELVTKDFTIPGEMSKVPRYWFKADGTITRAEFITLLIRTLGYEAGPKQAEIAAKSYFDVKADAWYAPYIGAAWEKGIIDPDPIGTFAPDRPALRMTIGQAIGRAGLIEKVVPLWNPAEKGPFDDLDPTKGDPTAWDILSAYNGGLIKGKSANLFDPGGTATRAEAATLLVRLAKKLPPAEGVTIEDLRKVAEKEWLAAMLQNKNQAPLSVNGSRAYMGEFDTASAVEANARERDAAAGMGWYRTAHNVMAGDLKDEPYFIGRNIAKAAVVRCSQGFAYTGADIGGRACDTWETWFRVEDGKWKVSAWRLMTDPKGNGGLGGPWFPQWFVDWSKARLVAGVTVPVPRETDPRAEPPDPGTIGDLQSRKDFTAYASEILGWENGVPPGGETIETAKCPPNLGCGK